MRSALPDGSWVESAPASRSYAAPTPSRRTPTAVSASSSWTTSSKQTEACRPCRRLLRAFALPHVDRQPMREAPSGAQVGEPDSRHERVLTEADHIAVEAVRRLEVGDVQVHVADLRAGRKRPVQLAVPQV